MPSPAIFRMKAPIRTRRKLVTPRTPMQKAYVTAIRSHELVFGTGPAGTGKTYLAVACAAAALMNGEVDRIVLSRPAVEAGERLGFLPGDMKEKVDPYLRPLYDALYDVMPRRARAEGPRRERRSRSRRSPSCAGAPWPPPSSFSMKRRTRRRSR